MFARRVSRAPRRSPAFATRRSPTTARTVGTSPVTVHSKLAGWETARVSARNTAHHLSLCSQRPSTSFVAFNPLAMLAARRPHTTQSPKGKEPGRSAQDEHDHAHQHEHEHEHHHEHSHSHSHSVFGSLAHSHSHGEDGHGDAERVVEALKGGGTSSEAF